MLYQFVKTELYAEFSMFQILSLKRISKSLCKTKISTLSNRQRFIVKTLRWNVTKPQSLRLPLTNQSLKHDA